MNTTSDLSTTIAAIINNYAKQLIRGRENTLQTTELSQWEKKQWFWFCKVQKKDGDTVEKNTHSIY